VVNPACEAFDSAVEARSSAHAVDSPTHDVFNRVDGISRERRGSAL